MKRRTAPSFSLIHARTKIDAPLQNGVLLSIVPKIMHQNSVFHTELCLLYGEGSFENPHVIYMPVNRASEGPRVTK